MAAIVHCAHSYAAALNGDRVASLEAADDGQSVRSSMTHVVARAHIHTGLLLCDAAIHRRDPAAAAKELHSVQELLPSEPDAVLFVQWADELEDRLANLRDHG